MENKSYANIILIPLLIISIMLTGYVGYNYINDLKSVKAPNFINKNINEVYAWCSELSGSHGCEFIYEDSRQYNKGTVFYQSVNEGEKINSSIVFKVSSKLIEAVNPLDINNNTTRAEVENWLKRNNIVDYEFIEQEDGIVEKGIVIKIEPKDNIYTDTPVTIYISSGKKASDDVDDPNTIKVDYGDYIALSESEFKNRTKKLGLNPVHNSSRDAYSTSVEKGYVVWHGSGDYVENEDISYGISKGKNDNEIYISFEKYVDKSESEFISEAKKLGLTPNHNTDRDNYSDTIEKGKIVWHGSGTYIPEEIFNYGLSLGKKGSDSEEIEVLRNQFTDLSPEEFEKKTKDLTLAPYHDPDCDDYSDTIAKGKVVWHGYGIYEKNEKIRYGLSLGKESGSSSDDSDDIRVNKGQYTGLTVSEFESKTKALGLDPYHDPGVDDYSDTIEKGKIVWHGSGYYVKNEKIRYGLSLGKKDSDTPTADIEVGNYTGKAESELVSFLNSNGLKGKKSEEYSSKYAQGIIISNDTGKFSDGATINYVVSAGTKNANIMAAKYYDVGDSYASTKAKMESALAPFTNVRYYESTSTLGVGQLEKIVVNGSSSYSPGSYPVDTPIEIYIVSKQSN